MMASEMVRMRNVARPVAKVMVAVGSAPRLLVAAPHTRRAAGMRHAIQVAVFRRMIGGAVFKLILKALKKLPPWLWIPFWYSSVP